MKYVEIDERSGTVSWERYFEYLRSVQQQFPSELYAYAIKWEHYALDSMDSLHDAWLTCARFAYRERELTFEFLGPWHDRTQIMRYVGVKSYAFDILVEHRLGDGDVLVHEFRIEDGRVVHEIVFSNRKCIMVAADNVLIRTELHASPTAARND
jgi:hypothetical protein